jgi:choice-of-anchor A domain-containing protein
MRSLNGDDFEVTADGVCPFAPNLGEEFSGPTGADHYIGEWPPVQGVPALGVALGRDDSVAFFVGRNYYGTLGAEIEGKMVIMGNLVNENVNSMVQVGLGSHIIPNNGQDIITVGGTFETKSDIAIMQNSAFVSGNIVHKGNLKQYGNNIWTNGQITKNKNLDLTGYTKALDELKIKSAYWADRPVNGVYTPYNQGPNGNTAVFKAGNNDCVQVFHLSEDEFDDLPWGIHVQFDANLKDKTVLINYGSDNQKNVKITNLANFFDPSGNGHWEFDSSFTASILWNFYDAEYVDLGGGSDGVGEFQGSILVPNGSLMMQFPGQSGRTIVGLDITQNRGGSEFHSYPFNPPKCNLPLPPCGSETVPPTPSPTKAPTPSPTRHPTPSPTKAPTPSPTRNPTPSPTKAPTPSPTNNPTPSPTKAPTPSPTNKPTPGPTNKPTASPTPGPTPGPTNKPTASPTPGPTNKPNPRPTNKPTASPTASPTPGPTNKPTTSPTPGPTKAPLVATTKAPVATSGFGGGGFSGGHPGYTPLGNRPTTTVGVTQPPGKPIIIGQQNCIDMDFGVINPFEKTVDYIFVQYTDLATHQHVCVPFSNVTIDWGYEFSTRCMRNAAVSVVTIIIRDSSFSDHDKAVLPNCCGDNDILGEIAGTPDSKTVSYTYVLDCCPVLEEVKCPAPEPAFAS